MSYSKAGAEKFTLIENLPDLDDLEETSSVSYSGKRTQSNRQPEQPTGSQMSKYLIGSHNRPTIYQDPPSESMQQHQHQHQQQHYHQQDHQHQEQQHHHHQDQQQVSPLRGIGAPTCLDIADHISQCPLCSKFYKNDKTVYIVVIVILIIICILLLKRALE